MSKMHKSFVPRSPFTTRERRPIMAKDKKGVPVLMCPFCTPPHPITEQTSSMCGTTLKVAAVQQVYKVKSANPNAVCVKCGSGKGEMVLFNGGLVHIHDCKPGTVTLTIPPKFSSFAKWVYGLKDGKVKNILQKRYGRAANVKEILPDGKETGKILGYFFVKARTPNDNRTDRESQPTETLPTEPVS